MQSQKSLSMVRFAFSLCRSGHYQRFLITRHTSSHCPSCYRHISVLAILCSSSLQLSVRWFQQTWIPCIVSVQSISDRSEKVLINSILVSSLKKFNILDVVWPRLPLVYLSIRIPVMLGLLTFLFLTSLV